MAMLPKVDENVSSVEVFPKRGVDRQDVANAIFRHVDRKLDEKLKDE